MESFGRYASYARIFARTTVALASLWWIFARLPVAGNLFRRLSTVLASPLSVFIICHVIVASLIADSGKLSLRSTKKCGEFDGPVVKRESGGDNDSIEETRGDEVVFVDKQVISETKGKYNRAVGSEYRGEVQVILRRWQSENFESSSRVTLRRSESEKRFEISDLKENEDSSEELSDEDFNRTVEAFIAKQLMFRRQELVIPSSSPEVSPLCATRSTTINA